MPDRKPHKITKKATKRRIIIVTRLTADRIIFPLAENLFFLLLGSYAPMAQDNRYKNLENAPG